MKTIRVGSGCNADEIYQLQRTYRRGLQYCHEKQLAGAPMDSELELSWRIGTNGAVSDARILSSTLKNSAIDGCVLRQLARWQFSEQAEGCAVVSIYRFHSQ